MASAEFAVALAAVIFVLAIVLNAVVIGINQVRCVDAARAGARAASRADSTGSMNEAAQRAGPPGVSVSATTSGEWVRVTARAPVPGPMSWLVRGAALQATATAAVESGSAGS